MLVNIYNRILLKGIFFMVGNYAESNNLCSTIGRITSRSKEIAFFSPLHELARLLHLSNVNSKNEVLSWLTQSWSRKIKW